MKKVITLLLAIIMVVSMFAACTPAEGTPGGNESESKAPAASGNNGGNSGNSGNSGNEGESNDPAVTDPEFLAEAVKLYGDRIVVGVDVKDGFVAIKGWLEISEVSCFDFCEKLSKMGVNTVICTDISKDGMMSGTNVELYRQLKERFGMNIIASGGVSSIDDVRALSEMDIFGAIVGKALYTGDVDLERAISVAGGEAK